jgi:hypothetical protein
MGFSPLWRIPHIPFYVDKNCKLLADLVGALPLLLSHRERSSLYHPNLHKAHLEI